MTVAKKHVYAILAAATLAVAYLLYSIIPPSGLQFRDRAFPPGFRDLVLESVSSQVDPLFGPQQTPRPTAPSKMDARGICDALFRDLDSPAVGNRDADLQIAAFLDYRCPYCRKLSAIIPELQAHNVRIVYKEWPILGESSVLAARAGLAADRQGKYLAFHTRLMNSRLIPTAAYIDEIAGELGMNRSQLRKDMNSAELTRAIERTSEIASALGLVGTPALVVGRTIVQGEITRSQLERLIENEIGLQSPRPC